ARQAEAQRKTAEQEKARAQKAQREAEGQTAEAQKQRQIALDARKKEEQQRQAVALALARSDVQDAARLADLNRTEASLAYLARALRGDPTSVGARSWIFDLLVRGGSPLPSEALKGENRVYSFNHQPLQHPARVLWADYGPNGRLVTAAWDNA